MKYFIEIGFSHYGTQAEAIEKLELNDKSAFKFENSEFVGTAEEFHSGYYREELPLYADRNLIGSLFLYVKNNPLKGEYFTLRDSEGYELFTEDLLNKII